MNINIKTVVYCGYGGNRFLAEELQPIIEKAGYSLRIISEWDSNPKYPNIEYVKWNINTWKNYMSQADVAMAPQRTEIQGSKSHCKALDAASAGLPLIASPLKSYIQLNEQFPNSIFIANNQQEWKDALVKLNNPEERIKYAKRLKEAVKKFHVSNIAKQWSHLINPVKSQETHSNHLEKWGSHLSPNPDGHLNNVRDRIHWEYTQKHLKGVKKILDIGCFSGWMSILLGREGYEVLGIDFVPPLIELAKRGSKDMPNVRFEVMDLENWNLKEKFDLIICYEVLEHLLEPKLILEKLKKNLTPSGKLLLSVPDQMRVNYQHAWIPSPNKIKEKLGNIKLEKIIIPGRFGVPGNYFSAIKNTQDIVVIIPTCKENEKYYNLCVRSLKEQGLPIKIFPVDFIENKFNFSQSLNYGIKNTTEEFILLSNNDLIYCKDSVRNMLDKMEDKSLVSSLSNCQVGWRAPEMLVTGNGLRLVPKMRLDKEIKESDYQDIFDFGARVEETASEKVKEYGWLPFFSVLLKRDAIKDIGYLDEKFKTGSEDLDYSIRAKKKDYKLIQSKDSFIFHFGAVSREGDENKDPYKHREEDAYNNDRIKIKYDKPTLAFWTGPAFQNWDESTPEKEGIGGSETAVVYLSKYLSEDYNVFVFGNPNKEHITEEGVIYKHYQDYEKWQDFNLTDYLIVERKPSFINNNLRAGKIILDHHDQFYTFGERFKNENLIWKHFARSPFHANELMRAHKIPEGKIIVIPNGINLSLFNNKVEKSPHRMLWASSPDRGLEIVLENWVKIKREFDDAKLIVCYGFENWDKSIEQSGDELQRKTRDNIKELMKQDGIEYKGKINQRELAIEYQRAEVLPFPRAGRKDASWINWATYEIICLEAMAGGSVIVASNIGALPTTIEDAGIRVEGDPYSKEFQDKWLKELLKVLSSKRYKDKYLEKGFERVKDFDWERIAQIWKGELKE